MQGTGRGFVVLLLVLCSAFAKAQTNTTSRTSPNAERKYDKFAFIDSREVYEKMANKGFKSVEIFSKLGDTYYFNNDYQNALKWYDQLFELDNAGIPEVYFFRYAQTLKTNRQYAKADQVLRNYSSNGNLDSRLKDLRNTPNYLTIVDFQKGRFEVKPVAVNSEYQDFGTAYYGPSQLVFASARDTGVFNKRRHSWNEKPFLDLYVAEKSVDGTLSSVEKFDSRINSILHESTPTFSVDQNIMYFTRNNYENGNLETDDQRINRLQIFRSIKTKGRWGKPVIVDFSMGDYSTSHPALTPDGKTLYFSSDMPGTMGEKGMFQETDIWRVTVEDDGTHSNLENVSLVNTEGRESYPYVSRRGNLYFSSNGLQGLGGLDIFVATINKDGSLSNPVNIGEPVNGVNDDFAFIVDEAISAGYFSSNRLNGGDNDDIYSFVQLEDLREICEQILTGTITDAVSKEALDNAMITLIDENNNVVAKRFSDSNGKYAFKLECGKTYFLRGEKREYNTAEELVKTPTKTGMLEVDLVLDPTSLKGRVGDDLAKLLNLNPIYFDFDMSFIREDAELELQKVLSVLEDNPTLKIDIRSHTDSRGTSSYNERLSERRAASTRNYLISKGIDASRLTSKGYGESELVNECSDGKQCSEQQHQQNRRSEFIIISI